ncbi:hypothetical protein P168DRAFT_71075 [Aspergillus campestris IBT 28561]|uniref:Uncharacterized protein n=1 Tax=Aspergillus campestris (strain IBT 28561) TaxID=1392248 RepID=A0A2I1CSQ7_ASPC2|nr:uncharacterized protein P168DRAFT_71075 [Aspergillus campestris IBT 28561]PKY00654.1 hypothetical protein P168DRAFT_71075 [Aspergillus campestris IBT 28561]
MESRIASSPSQGPADPYFPNQTSPLSLFFSLLFSFACFIHISTSFQQCCRRSFLSYSVSTRAVTRFQLHSLFIFLTLRRFCPSSS